MKLTVTHHNGMIRIKSDDINYSLIEGMYGHEDGYALQVNDEDKRETIKKMCDAITIAVLEFKRTT